MEKYNKIFALVNSRKRAVVLCFVSTVLFYLPSQATTAKSALLNSSITVFADSAFSTALKSQINGIDELNLNYPNSVKRFYAQYGYQPAWVKPQSGFDQTWQAMLMLDCVLQYGLTHADYHPKECFMTSCITFLKSPGNMTMQKKPTSKLH